MHIPDGFICNVNDVFILFPSQIDKMIVAVIFLSRVVKPLPTVLYLCAVFSIW